MNDDPALRPQGSSASQSSSSEPVIQTSVVKQEGDRKDQYPVYYLDSPKPTRDRYGPVEYKIGSDRYFESTRNLVTKPRNYLPKPLEDNRAIEAVNSALAELPADIRKLILKFTGSLVYFRLQSKTVEFLKYEISIKGPIPDFYRGKTRFEDVDMNTQPVLDLSRCYTSIKWGRPIRAWLWKELVRQTLSREVIFSSLGSDKYVGNVKGKRLSYILTRGRHDSFRYWSLWVNSNMDWQTEDILLFRGILPKDCDEDTWPDRAF